MNLEVLYREPVQPKHATPILFLHGMYHGAWCWDEYFLPYFAERGYDVFAMSLRGHGQSEGHVRWARLHDYVDDLAQVVAQFKTPPILVGHSMGGLVVQKYLEAHAAPAAVLVASAPPFGIWHSFLSSMRKHPLATLQTMLTLNPRALVSTPALYRELFHSPSRPEEKLLKYFAHLSDASLFAVLDMLGLDLPHADRIQTPLLVLGAAHDGSIHPPHFEATAKIYNAEFHAFPMNHSMMLEEGWQSVADCILTWLDQRHL